MHWRVPFRCSTKDVPWGFFPRAPDRSGRKRPICCPEKQALLDWPLHRLTPRWSRSPLLGHGTSWHQNCTSSRGCGNGSKSTLANPGPGWNGWRTQTEATLKLNNFQRFPTLMTMKFVPSWQACIGGSRTKSWARSVRWVPLKGPKRGHLSSLAVFGPEMKTAASIAIRTAPAPGNGVEREPTNGRSSLHSSVPGMTVQSPYFTGSEV